MRQGSMHPAATRPAKARLTGSDGRRPSIIAVTPMEVNTMHASTCTSYHEPEPNTTQAWFSVGTATEAKPHSHTHTVAIRPHLPHYSLQCVRLGTHRDSLGEGEYNLCI
jgi:hypothetical protein